MNRVGTEQALKLLKEGNSRFRDDLRTNDFRQAKLRRDQRPATVVLTCADSRVVPEILFDSGLGDLFVVRVAGNIANTASIASIEFAVSTLGISLIVVLGHQNCGAISAALESADSGKNLNRLLEYIQPAIESTPGKDADSVARANARQNAERLVAESAILRQAVEEGLRIMPAFFHLDSGEVEFI